MDAEETLEKATDWVCPHGIDHAGDAVCRTCLQEASFSWTERSLGEEKENPGSIFSDEDYWP